MTANIALQIQLPAELTLSPEQLQHITGFKPRTKQIQWLEEHRWPYELSATGDVLVGSLYANLRLAGLNPASVTPPPLPGGFDLSGVR